MIHAQEAEDRATISHVRPIFHSIQRLGGSGQRQIGHSNQISLIKETSFTANADDTYMQQTSSGYGLTNDSIVSTPPPSSVATSVSYDDKLTYETMRRFKDAPLILSMDDSKDYEVLKTDQQLCLVLKTIVESSDYRRNPDAGITFAEFVHVYKIAVSGMQALQMLPAQGRSNSSDSDRKRTWSRCLVMMQSFSQFEVTQIENSNYSVISNEDDDDGQVLNKMRFLENLEGRDFETTPNPAEKEKELQIAKLTYEINARKRKSNVLLFLLLLVLATSVSLGYYQVHVRLPLTPFESKGDENNQDSILEKTPSGPQVSGNLVGDLVITLAQTQEELNSAKTQVGSMVLEMNKVNHQLATCLRSTPQQGDRWDASSVQSTSSPKVMESKTADIEKNGENASPLLSPAVRQQIVTVLSTAAIMAIPSFLPVKLLQRFATIFARFVR